MKMGTGLIIPHGKYRGQVFQKGDHKERERERGREE